MDESGHQLSRALPTRSSHLRLEVAVEHVPQDGHVALLQAASLGRFKDIVELEAQVLVDHVLEKVLVPGEGGRGERERKKERERERKG